MNIANNNPGTPADWTPFISPYQSQYSATAHTDYQNCVCFSAIHIAFSLTGRFYSARALAVLAGVTPNGTTVENVVATINKYGLIPNELWPELENADWATYYAPIPQDVLDKADMLKFQLVAPDLNVSPLWTEIIYNPKATVPGPLHMVEQINATQFFDSEVGAPIKPLDYEGASIGWQSSVVIPVPDHLTTETSDPVTVNTQTV